MAIRTYLAMTASEFAKADPLPPHVAWMACHFSPYDSGLTNLPRKLPTNSLLILNKPIFVGEITGSLFHVNNFYK